MSCTDGRASAPTPTGLTTPAAVPRAPHAMHLEDFLDRRSVNHQPLTPVTFLWRTAALHPDKPAVIDAERRLNWREFAHFVRSFAGALRRRGISKGDVVSILAPNCLELLASHFAVPMTGAVLNTINTRLDADTVSYITTHAGSRLLVVHPDCRAVVNAALGQAERRCPVVWLDDPSGGAPRGTGESFAEFMLDSPAATEDLVDDEWQPICLNYTSGTTGRPKGVVCHHRGAFLNGLGNVLAMGFSANTRYLWILPMFHCNGWAHTWAVTAAGGTHVCIERPEPRLILRAISDLAITHMSCAPVVLYMLSSDAGLRQLELKEPLTVATGGASPTSRLIADLESAGFRLIHLYGLTESYGPATLCVPEPEWAVLSVEERALKLSRQGLPHATAGDALVVDTAGVEVPADGRTMGEIVLRGNTLMAGYYRDGPATEQAFAGGMFHTGDLAVRHPDGQIQIRDRAKDVIISGGENIASVEIENALHQHHAVLLAAVVAMPDEKWGEVPCAFVESRPGVPVPAEAELIEHCRGRLAGFKVPKRVILGEIPKTATGKIQKYLLRSQLAGRAGGNATGPGS